MAASAACNGDEPGQVPAGSQVQSIKIASGGTRLARDPLEHLSEIYTFPSSIITGGMSKTSNRDIRSVPPYISIPGASGSVSRNGAAEFSHLKDLTGCKGDLSTTLPEIWSTMGVPSQHWNRNNFCTWTGVTCDPSQSWPVELDLSGMLCNGSISPSIGQLVNLTTINLSINLFTGSLPLTIGNLTSLLSIDLSMSSLGGNIPYTIGGWKSIQYLSFFNNQFDGSIPSTIGDLTNLQFLDLSYNALNGSIPSSIVGLTSIATINIHNNNITGEIPSVVSNITSMITLDLSYNFLVGPIPDVSHIQYLQFIRLGNNRLNGSIPVSIANLPLLQDLDLSFNQLTGQIPSMKSIETVKLFQLNDNQLEGPVPDSIINLPGHQLDLYLQNNHLNGTVTARNASLPALRNLNLANNFFTSFGYVNVTFNCDLLGNRIPCSSRASTNVSSICLNKLSFLPCNSTVGTSTSLSTISTSPTAISATTSQTTTSQTTTSQTTTSQTTTSQTITSVDTLYDYITIVSVKQAENILNSVLGEQIEIVKTISAVSLALSRNTSASFEYNTRDVSIKLQTYDTNKNGSQSLESKITNSTVAVAIPASVLVVMSLSSISYNPFGGVNNQSIGVIGVNVYAEGREIEVKGISDLINITMGSVRAIPPDHYAVCQYWNESSSLWSRDGCNLIVDDNVTICQTSHLTNFSIGIQPVISPSVVLPTERAVNAPSAQGDDKTKMIIIIACCGAGGLLLILVLSLFIYHRRSKNKDVELRSSIILMEVADSESSGKIEWRERVSHGDAADVWRATQNETTLVAIKKKGSKNIRALLAEATRLKTMHHPNIVMYLAQNLSEGWLMIEWMDKGSLFSYAQHHSISSLFSSIGRDVAQGMSYVAEQKIVHTQLHSHHILLQSGADGSIVAKITSFGECIEEGMKSERKPSHHTAPEVVKYGVQYVQSDVWSFGNILLFIARDGREMSERKSVKRRSEMIEEEWEASVRGMIQDCMEEEMNNRPTFTEIARKMKRQTERERDKNDLRRNMEMKMEDMTEEEHDPYRFE
ncbi:receptor like protein 35 [Planoprotostelium fungivorum]|uniref:Receptor like protein 35 n=1 Tax=Planoprotostelium fungivorum TaxID=1890364 RepID=A0A2P6N7G2_9EUKA|nr:receptor like protein 35 [Planoprotostelium fungivorum]